MSCCILRRAEGQRESRRERRGLSSSFCEGFTATLMNLSHDNHAHLFLTQTPPMLSFLPTPLHWGSSLQHMDFMGHIQTITPGFPGVFLEECEQAPSNLCMPEACFCPSRFSHFPISVHGHPYKRPIWKPERSLCIFFLPDWKVHL